MKTKISFLIIVLPFLSLIFFGFKGDDKKRTGKINVNDVYEFIAINNILMWVSNNGDGSHDPRSDGNGFYWPGGIYATKSAIFQDGLIFAARIRGDLHVGGSTYRQGLQAGKIINGVPDDPSLEKYRIYKITRGWENLPPGPERDAREKDYNEWPMEDGAPYIDINEDGQPTPGIDIPEYIGDETLWYVSNDMDPSRTTYLYGTQPMGLEIQTTVYGYDRLNYLGDVVFKKHIIINKSNNILNDMYIGYWSDADLGDASDDYTGCDTILHLGYAWNSDNFDGTYGTPPPSVGYTLLQGPVIPGNNTDSAYFLGDWRKSVKNLPLSAFVNILKNSPFPFNDPPNGSIEGAEIINNYLQGKNQNGDSIFDPHTGVVTKYMVPGDPVLQTGWFEGGGWQGGPTNPGDRRMIMSSGPLTLAPGDTQEVVYAIHISMGLNNINSISSLKFQSSILKPLHLSGQISLPENPVVHAMPQKSKVLLWWENNSENYNEFDPVLPDTIIMNLNGTDHIIPVTDKYFNFEGYRVWQFKDETGRDPVLLSTFDIQNGISKTYSYPYEFIFLNSQPLPVEPLLVSPDQGLKRMIMLDNDFYTDSPLLNGSEYYFAVTAYGYNRFSDPPIIESEPEIIKVIPGTQPVDLVNIYNQGDTIHAAKIAGSGDGNVRIKIIDPSALMGHDYRVEFYGNVKDTSLNYSLINTTTNSVLISKSTDFNGNFESSPVFDGFQIAVYNTGWDSITAQPVNTGLRHSMVKEILETNGPGNTKLEVPQNVFHQLNSTGEWMIKAPGQTPLLNLDSNDTRQNIDWMNNLGFNDYEIRFTESGSQYYITGFSGTRPPFLSDPRGEGKVPFEIWNVRGYNSDTSSAVREFIKIWDASIRDSVWTQNPATLEWEAIFSYEAPYIYSEPIAPVSGTVADARHRIGNFVISGSLPESGTIIKIITFKPLSEGDEFSFTAEASYRNHETAKQNINNISVFPNPYYGANEAIGDYPPYIRFTNLPEKVIIRIFSLGGVYINKIEKDEAGQYLDWDLRNKDGYMVASGIYLAYIEFPGIGNKILKIAVAR